MRELSEKEKAERDGYINMLLERLKRENTVAGLEACWKWNLGNLKYFDIIKGTPEYDKLVDAFKEHKATLIQPETVA